MCKEKPESLSDDKDSFIAPHNHVVEFPAFPPVNRAVRVQGHAPPMFIRDLALDLDTDQSHSPTSSTPRPTEEDHRPTCISKLVYGVTLLIMVPFFIFSIILWWQCIEIMMMPHRHEPLLSVRHDRSFKEASGDP